MTGQPISVLFVDDDPMVTKSIGRCLERIGFAVTTTGVAEEALALAKTTRFDAIVTDHQMPSMTGAELIGHLLAQDSSLRGRIILTSGDLDTAANSALLAETGSRGLHKPFNMAELALAVRAAAGAAPPAKLTAA